ncbi:YcbK family protein [Nitratireductor basaltis]|uniref:Murein endopeptidase K n=1 Tax=Nitratireductor basaltis TaxID=472175 RepID=A0A084UBC2_9HYPH|nr:YcbK family protein [Nitratireductor basaltis]KFB10258.1 Peptidase M15A [Nitratireductor basaltis]
MALLDSRFKAGKANTRLLAGVALASVLLASCSAGIDSPAQLGLLPENGGISTSGETTLLSGGADLTPTEMVEQGFETADAVPSPRPQEEVVSAPTEEVSAETAEEAVATAAASSQPEVTEAADNDQAGESDAAAAVAELAEGNNASADTSNATLAAEVSEQKKRGFLSSFFSSTPANAKTNPAQPLVAAAKPEAEKAEEPAKPLISLSYQSGDGSDGILPGVRQGGQLFEISRKANVDDDSDLDLYESESPIQVASAAGLARLAPNGLLKQRESVDVSCLKPALVKMVRQIERRFGNRAVVTSGYRSPSYNKRVRGARNSLHMYCAAVDIQIDGVSKWDIAKYARSLPGRGGVGTYCHTNSVHVDIGPERDWNWRCRRKR